MPIKKDTPAKKPAPRTRAAWTRKSSTTKTVKVEDKVAQNARHIQENAKTIENNSNLLHILYGVIIFLMMLIAGLAFYVGTLSWSSQGWSTVTNWENAPVNAPVQDEDITVTIIGDSRCSDCPTADISSQLQSLPFLASASFEQRDFMADDMADYLKENSITMLPAAIFSTNNLVDGGQITPYLQALPNGSYSLIVGAKFDPFAQRSENWFLIATQEVLNEIKATANLIGPEEAQITWVEYTDVNCGFCQKMAKDSTAEKVLEKFPQQVNKNTVNFIGVGWANTQAVAEVLECVASLTNSDNYNSVLDDTLISGNTTKDNVITLAVSQGVNETELNSCIENGDSKDLVAEKDALWRNAFGITGTPGNVIINNETWEYEIVSGAYPVETFVTVIERMLAE